MGDSKEEENLEVPYNGYSGNGAQKDIQGFPEIVDNSLRSALRYADDISIYIWIAVLSMEVL